MNFVATRLDRNWLGNKVGLHAREKEENERARQAVVRCPRLVMDADGTVDAAEGDVGACWIATSLRWYAIIVG